MSRLLTRHAPQEAACQRKSEGHVHAAGVRAAKSVKHENVSAEAGEKEQ